MMGKLMQYIYCMEIGQVLLWIAAATCGFLWLEGVLRQRRFWKWLKSCALIALITVIGYFTLVNRDGAQIVQKIEPLFQSYREVQNGGNVEIYRSNFMNMMLFYPAGLLGVLLLPKKWPAWRRCILTVPVLTAMSVGIEFLQYQYALGRCEADDVLHNVAGALLGVLAAEGIPKLVVLLKKHLLPRVQKRMGK